VRNIELVSRESPKEKQKLSLVQKEEEKKEGKANLVKSTG